MGDGFSNNQRSDNYSGSGASRYNDGARDSGNRQMNDFRYYSLLSAYIYSLYIQGGEIIVFPFPSKFGRESLHVQLTVKSKSRRFDLPCWTFWPKLSHIMSEEFC